MSRMSSAIIIMVGVTNQVDDRVNEYDRDIYARSETDSQPNLAHGVEEQQKN